MRSPIPYAEIEPYLDLGIRPIVALLRAHHIETVESCEGGTGHCFPVPTVRFSGDRTIGFRAFALATEHGYAIADLKRCWSIVDGEPVGPEWEMTLARRGAPGEPEPPPDVARGC
jgi:hypothetical protein